MSVYELIDDFRIEISSPKPMFPILEINYLNSGFQSYSLLSKYTKNNKQQISKYIDQKQKSKEMVQDPLIFASFSLSTPSRTVKKVWKNQPFWPPFNLKHILCQYSFGVIFFIFLYSFIIKVSLYDEHILKWKFNGFVDCFAIIWFQ